MTSSKVWFRGAKSRQYCVVWPVITNRIMQMRIPKSDNCIFTLSFLGYKRRYSFFFLTTKVGTFRGNYIFPHELPTFADTPSRTTNLTKIEHSTTTVTYFAPFRQSEWLK
jgi:hypothetical protein